MKVHNSPARGGVREGLSVDFRYAAGLAVLLILLVIVFWPVLRRSWRDAGKDDDDEGRAW
jgi:hypothetical protein